MPDEPTTTTTTTQADVGKTTTLSATPPANPPTTTEDKGADDIEGLKRHNKALLTELTNKKAESNDYKGKYEALQSEKDKREAEEAAKRGEFKELLEKEQAKNQNFQKQIMKEQVRAFAFREGIIDPDLVDVIPTEQIKITSVNDTVQVTGAEDAVKAYKTAKPHLFKAAEVAAAVAAGAAPATTPATKATGASVTDPSSAGNTTNALAAGVKPGSKEAQALESAYLAKWNR